MLISVNDPELMSGAGGLLAFASMFSGLGFIFLDLDPFTTVIYCVVALVCLVGYLYLSFNARSTS